MQRRWTEGSAEVNTSQEEEKKSELAGRKKCGGDEVQSGSPNAPCQNLSAGGASVLKRREVFSCGH